jgi:HEAT repeat protein
MTGKTGHLFLSYCSTDLRFALQIATDLKNAGVNVWMDRLDIKPGDDWRKSLEEGVDNSVGVIAILSPEYTQSKYCRLELARADRLNLPIVLVLLKPLGDSDRPLEIERAQYIDFTEWPSEEAYREHRDRLVSVLQGRFAAQISPEPDPETRYLTNLLACLETQKGLAQYVDLATEADKWQDADLIRPEPRSSKAWAVNGPLSLLHYLPEKVASTGKLQLYPPHQRITHLQSIHEVLKEHNRFVLVGGPGSGKTIVLQHLLLDAALARLSNAKAAPLPFWLDLIDWDDSLTLEQFIRLHWPFDTDPIKLLARGEVILFLHGLDMLHPFKAGALRDWLHSDNAPPRVILTCRTADYDAGRNMHLSIVQIQEMDREHIEQFVTHYLGEKAAGIFMSRVFPDEKGKDYLYQFARNPFLLSALILLFKSSEYGDLPQNLGLLLKQLAREIWEREHLYRPSPGIPYTEMETALGDLAYAMLEADVPMFVSREYALEHIGSEALLIEALQSNYLETKGDNIRFSYKLIQDYFTAVGVKNEDRAGTIPRPRLGADGRRVASRWDMVKLILIGQDPNPDATLREIANVNPFLALECIASGVTISDNSVHVILSEMQKNVAQEEGINCIEMVRILSTIDAESALRVLPGILRGAKWELRWAATLLLWDMDIPYFEGLVEALENLDDRIKDETALVLRQLDKQVLPSLIHLLRHPNWKLRRDAAWGLGVLRDRAGVPGLVAALHDLEHNAAAAAADSLSDIRDPDAIPWLLNTLHHKHWKAKKAAAKALGSMGGAALNGLITTLNEGAEDSRRLVIEALKSIQTDSVTAILLQATYDESAEVRGAAIDALENQHDDEIIKRLIECLGDNTRLNSNRKLIADMAAEVLEKSGRPEALEAVKTWRENAIESPTEPVKSASLEKLTDTQTSALTAKERLKKIKTQEAQIRPARSQRDYREAGKRRQRRDTLYPGKSAQR